MTNKVLKARYITKHELVVIMNGDWSLKRDIIRKYYVNVPDYAECKATYNETTDTTIATFNWGSIDETPNDMLQH